MVQVEIRCPACDKRGKIDIEADVINQSSRGITAINIARDQICGHSFVAYVDKNMDIRDCFLTDFQIELPSMESKDVVEERDIPDRDIVDIDLLKLNIHALQLASLLRGFFFKQQVVFVYDQDFLYKHIQNFFKFVFRNSFDYDLILLNQEDYKKNKKKYKKSLVLGVNKIWVDKQKILDPKKIKVERNIVQKFYGEYGQKSSLIIMKNEIQKAHELSKQIIHLMETYDGEEKLGKKKLIDYLAQNEGIKISFSYLEFLLDIVKNNFNFDMSVLSDYYFPAFGI